MKKKGSSKSLVVILIVIGIFLIWVSFFLGKNIGEKKAIELNNNINNPSGEPNVQEQNAGQNQENPLESQTNAKDEIALCKGNDFCFQKTALEKKDPSICGEIRDSSVYDQCYSLIAIAMNDSSICAKIKKFDSVAICYTEIAKIKSDPELCKEINAEEFYKDQCYCVVAINKLDPEPISYINNPTTKNICYGRVADEKNDLSICNNIIGSSGMTKEDCINGAS
ncbi:MAG: hypothetical protein AABW75_01755 [Nanoarchaeota archaeon]